MNRKIDKNLKDLSSVSSEWTEIKRNVVPHSSGNPRVALTFDRSDKLSDKAMDPDVVTMKQFINTGIPVDPSAFAAVNRFNDPADLEQYLETHAGKVLDYAQRNKDAIIAAIKGTSAPSSEPDDVESVKSEYL